ncbi:MAG: hypothetical protein ACJ71Q_14215 [Terriglobales bacterium]|jgi:hypothetical protein
MKRAAKRKKSPSNNSDGFHRNRKVIEAIERVFRSTHKREMTSDERRKFRLPPLEDKEPKSDST